MTDNITLPRATVQQVLKTLEGIHRVDEYPELQPAVTALRAALKQQAEPVATHRITAWGHCGVCRHDRIPGEGCARQECPDSHQRKPLSEKQVHKIWRSLAEGEGIDEFARALEDAHGIKEGTGSTPRPAPPPSFCGLRLPSTSMKIGGLNLHG